MIIGIIHNNDNRIGGIENQILLLVNELVQSHTVYYFTRYYDSEICKRFKGDNIYIVPLTGGFINELKIVSQTIKRKKIEIIQSHTFDESIKYRFVKLCVPRVKVTVRVHTYIACSWIPIWRKRVYYFIDSITSPLVNRFILNGQYLVDEMNKNTFIPARKKVGIIDGTKEFLSNPTLELSKEDIQCPHFLMIANVIRHKGHDVLFKAIRQLKDQGIESTCTVLGATNRDVAYYRELQKLLKQEGIEQNVDFVGFTTEITKYLENTKIVVLPSDSEGTPNCIMEGMSMKRIVVVTNTGGVSEFVTDSKTGFLHEPLAPEAFVGVIQRMMKMSTESLVEIAENGFIFWKNNLSIHAMTDKFIKVYQSL